MRYWSRARGRAAKQVTCEECGAEYVYLLEREAVGEGSSPFFLDKRGAERRAAKRAERELARKLEAECDVAPCPKCGRIQADMVRMAKGERLRWLIPLGLIVGGLGVLLAVLNVWVPEAEIPWSLIAPVAGLGAAVLLARFAVVSATDPNDAHVEQRLALAQRTSLTREEFERRMREAPPA